jgi:hypothetical protein
MHFFGLDTQITIISLQFLVLGRHLDACITLTYTKLVYYFLKKSHWKLIKNPQLYYWLRQHDSAGAG